MLTGSGCPACGGALAPWRTAPAAEPGVGAVTLARCTACRGAVTLDPVPADAHETGDYAAGTPRGARPAAPLLRSFDRRRLALLRRAMPPPARLLDAGAGRGRFVRVAQRAGYDASGIEPSARGVAAGRALGVVLEPAAIEDATVPAGSLDAVCVWHVLEHVEDPGAALRTVRRWLAPGGVVLVGVPDLGSWQARIAGPRWYHLDVPRHRTHFTDRGLRALLEATGFELEASTHVLAEHNPLGMWLAWVSHGTRRPSYLYHLLKRNAPARSRDLAVSLLALPLLPLAVVVELAAGLAHRGGTVAITARAR